MYDGISDASWPPEPTGVHELILCGLPSLILQLLSGMCLECTSSMALPTHRKAFKLSLSLKTFPFLAHPITPASFSVIPLPCTLCIWKTTKFLSFLKEIWSLPSTGEFSWFYRRLLKSCHSPWPLEVTFLSLLCAYTSS